MGVTVGRVENSHQFVLTDAHVRQPVQVAAGESATAFGAAAPDTEHGAGQAFPLGLHLVQPAPHFHLVRLGTDGLVGRRVGLLVLEDVLQVLERAREVGNHGHSAGSETNVASDASSLAASCQALDLVQIFQRNFLRKIVVPLPVQKLVHGLRHRWNPPLIAEKVSDDSIVIFNAGGTQKEAHIIALVKAGGGSQINKLNGILVHGFTHDVV
mmetsp:Transcript_33586/g.57594  ORF Transcript_33586/g.57594 Transcript_33586/m.57594 type:complete len:212 (+) Transcript_33586:1428-2063(+)